MKIKHAQTYGWQAAFRGMRNSLNSWDKSDSDFLPSKPLLEPSGLGAEDLKLGKKLVRRGVEHRKFLRMIAVWADLTLPRYIWAEFDTYKIGVTRNSCSTMHTAMRRPLTIDDFQDQKCLPEVLKYLNDCVAVYKEKKDVKDLLEFKAHLPESFLQKSTICTNYEVLLNMYFQRRKHRLKEWHEICDWIKSLPYIADFVER